jgi:hypothetical protein
VLTVGCAETLNANAARAAAPPRHDTSHATTRHACDIVVPRRLIASPPDVQ